MFQRVWLVVSAETKKAAVFYGLSDISILTSTHGFGVAETIADIWAYGWSLFRSCTRKSSITALPSPLGQVRRRFMSDVQCAA
jgi:hypothetical protein